MLSTTTATVDEKSTDTIENESTKILKNNQYSIEKFAVDDDAQSFETPRKTYHRVTLLVSQELQE